MVSFVMAIVGGAAIGATCGIVFGGLPGILVTIPLAMTWGWYSYRVFN